MKALIASIAVLLLAGCARAPEPWVFSGPTMGTTYTVRVLSGDGLPQPAFVRERIERELSLVDAVASRYRNDSEISRFNASTPTEWIAVSAQFMDLLQTAGEVTSESSGAFDVVIAPVVDAWGFGPQSQQRRVPPRDELAQLRNDCGSQWLQMRRNPPALRKERPCVAIDVNALAPGYAVDRIHHALLALGARDFLIDIGGEVRVQGERAPGQSWRVAIEDPTSPQRAAWSIVELTNAAIATSGGYQQYFERNGRRYSHVIDARTGLAADADVAAVAVIAETAALADAWSTALYALGAPDGLQRAREQRMPALFLIWEQGKLVERATPEFLRHRVR